MKAWFLGDFREGVGSHVGREDGDEWEKLLKQALALSLGEAEEDNQEENS